MNKVCRTCLLESNEAEFTNIEKQMIGNESVLELIVKIGSVTVLNNDPLPKTICSFCLEKLHQFHKFGQIIVNADRTLKNKLTNEISSSKALETNRIENTGPFPNNNFKNHSLENCDDSNFTNECEAQSIKREDLFDSSLSKYLADDSNNSIENTGLKQHAPLVEQKNGKRMYKCEECNKLFKKADHYKVHMTTHTGEKKYACEFCPKRFARSYVLVYHRRVHTGERPYTCDICYKSFSSPSNFYTHKKIHSGEKNYKCELCDESFIQSDSLKIHIRRIHTGERPFLCEICSSAFRSNSSLLTHKLDLHGEKEACPVCYKTYSTRVLKEHMRRHKEKEQGIKRYACDQCGKRFTSSSSRKKHLLIHSGEKPYSCEICDKSFNQRSALKTHTRIHSEFKPFQCDFCPKSFRYKHHLRSHNNTHHKEASKVENSE